MAAQPNYEQLQAAQQRVAPSLFEPVSAHRSNNLFDWVDEMPRPPQKRAAQKDQISQMIFAAMALPYRGVWNPDTQRHEIEDNLYEGATYGEVMAFKLVEGAAQSGDTKPISEIFDRTLGKPKQAIESLNMNLSYAEFLEESLKQEMAQVTAPHQDPRSFYEMELDEPTTPMTTEELLFGI